MEKKGEVVDRIPFLFRNRIYFHLTIGTHKYLHFSGGKSNK